MHCRYAGAQVAGAQSAGGAAASAAPVEVNYSNAVEFPLDLQVGLITGVAPVPDSDKLYILQVDMGAAGGVRQIVSGLRKHYADAQAHLVGKRVVVVCNLKPVKFCGVQSNGMVLTAVHHAGDAADEASTTLGILTCGDTVAPGTKVAPRGAKVAIAAKFDLKKQMPLLPFAVVGASGAAAVTFAGLALQAGNPHAAQDNPAIVAERVAGDAGAKIM